MPLSSLFGELKRRNVFRVAVAYIVTSWLILQVADVVIGNVGAPPWVFSIFLLALVLGLFPALFFSWAYELTPEGLKKEEDVDRTVSITPETGRKLDMITIIMLVAVVAFVVIERNFFPTAPVTIVAERPAEPIAAPADVAAPEVVTTQVDDRSIAVLAFEDLSAAGDQAFFAEGLSEELLNVLAQVPTLKVAGRTSSFAFKGKDTDLREIGEILNVAHILEGSVRKAGNRIRVTAQLIKASDGFHLFSETYDRDLDDIFAVQDEIAALISTALKAELSGEDAVPHVTPTELAAYDLYLVARQRIRSRNPELMYEAMDMLDEALDIDPEYAPALAQRALAVYLLSDAPGAYGDIPEAEARDEANRLLDRALAADPNLAEGHAVLGLIQTDGMHRDQDAVASLRRALEINPNLESAKLWLANAVLDPKESTALYQEVILRDPMYTPAFNNLIIYYAGTSSFDEGDALIDRVERVTGKDHDVYQAMATLEFTRGDFAKSAEYYQVAFDNNPNATVVQAWRGYVLLFLGEMEDAVANGRESIALVAHRELGDHETAERIIQGMDFRLGDQQRRIRHAADYLGAVGKHQEMIDIIEQSFGGTEEIIETLPLSLAWGAEYLGPLAYVYLQAGREDDVRVLTDYLWSVLNRSADDGFNNWYHWYSRAQYHALIGEPDRAFEYLERAFDAGYSSVVFIEPLFEGLLGDDPRLETFKAKALARANEQRARLGLGPYQPAMASN